MKAIITVDVPEHQIGQEVSVYFKDTMCVKSVCTPLTFLKYRMKDYVFYNVDWLKEHWEKEMELLGVDFSKHDGDIIKETVASIWGKPCADAVSRQAVLDLAKFDGRDGLGSIIHAFDVEQLPPVYPQPKTGHWIEKNYNFDWCSAKCSICGKPARGLSKDTGWGFTYSFTDYCPNCGAKMESEDKE